MFAEKIPHFNDLHVDDKRSLIEHNFGLYFSYIFAKYVSADNGFDQLCCLFGANVPSLCKNWTLPTYANNALIAFPPTALAQVMMLQHVALPNVKAGTSLSAAMARYKLLCSLVGHNFNIAPNFNGLMAHYILFSTAHWNEKHEFKSGSKIEATFKLSDYLLRHKQPRILENGDIQVRYLAIHGHFWQSLP